MNTSNSKKNNYRKYLLNVVLIVVITGLSVFYLFEGDVINTDTLKSVTFKSIFIISLLFFFCMAIHALINYLTYKTFANKWSYGDAIGDSLIGNFGSNITPMKSGHFPLKIYYYEKKGLKLYQSLTGITKVQIIYSVTSILIYLAIFVFTTIHPYYLTFQNSTISLNLVVLIGVLTHILIAGLCLILSFNNQLQDKVLKIVSKIKYRRDLQKRAEYLQLESLKLRIYKDQIIEMYNNIRYYLPLTLTYAIYMFLFGSIPYVAYLLITGNPFVFDNFFYCYLLNLSTSYITNLIPIPGGSGSSEVIFSLVFANFIGGGILGSVIIIWRLATYFVPIVIEFIYFYIFTFTVRKKQFEVYPVTTQKVYDDEEQSKPSNQIEENSNNQ